MRRTVGDILRSPEIQRDADPRNRMAAMPETARVEESESLYVVRLLMDPNDVEILDGKLVYEKRIIARRHEEAVFRFGVDVNRQ